MHKRTEVKTNDPDKKKFFLVVQGKVEKVVTLKPAALYLNGKPGEVLESVVTIMPALKYNFSILDMAYRQNAGIEATLVKPENENQPWKVTVRVHSDKVANVFDSLILKTDSPHRPELKIRISALFRGEKLSQPQIKKKPADKKPG